MKIAVASQNRRTVTGHAGKTRRFRVFESAGDELRELELIDLPKEMTLHAYHGDDHPLFEVDVVITGGSGDPFLRRMARRGVRVINTSAKDVEDTVRAFVAGEELPAAPPHDDHDHDHDHGHGRGHGNGRGHGRGHGQGHGHGHGRGLGNHHHEDDSPIVSISRSK